MADWAALVRNLLRTVADPVTKSLQCNVTYQAYYPPTQTGDRLPKGSAQTWPAVVTWKQKVVRTLNGVEAVSRAEIQFLVPHDIDEGDKLVLPDGTTGPILDMTGTVDPSTGRAYVHTVWLG